MAELMLEPIPRLSTGGDIFCCVYTHIFRMVYTLALVHRFV